MSEILEGDEWKHQNPEPSRPAPGHLAQRTRDEQQAWLDDLYLRGQISLKVWRFQFDLLSLKNADGSLPPLE